MDNSGWFWAFVMGSFRMRRHGRMAGDEEGAISTHIAGEGGSLQV